MAVMIYFRVPLSLGSVEDLLHERGIDVSREDIRFWWNRFVLMFASKIPLAACSEIVRVFVMAVVCRRGLREDQK